MKEPGLSIAQERVEWEEEIIIQLETLGECTTSDAQAMMDAQPGIIAHAWGSNMTPSRTAKRILSQ